MNDPIMEQIERRIKLHNGWADYIKAEKIELTPMQRNVAQSILDDVVSQNPTAAVFYRARRTGVTFLMNHLEAFLKGQPPAEPSAPSKWMKHEQGFIRWTPTGIEYSDGIPKQESK